MTKKIVFSISVLVFSVVNLFFLITPTLYRDIPFDPDDTYHSLVKASNISNCITGDCAALDDIYNQTSIYTSDLQQNWFRERQKHRILYSYHPLYSFAISSISKIGISYENAKLVWDIIGIFLITLSMAFFLYVFFGISAASLAIIAITGWGMMGHGLIHVNYYLFSTGFAFLSWGLLASNNNMKRNLNLAMLSLLFSVSCHPIGIIYTGIALIFVLLNDRQLNYRSLMVFISCSFIFLLYVVVKIKFVDQNINIGSLYKVNVSMREVIMRNIVGIKSFLLTLQKNHVSVPMIFIYGIFGYLFSPVEKRKKILIMGFIMLGTFGASLFYPNITGDAGSTILYRISPIYYVFFYGLFGVLGSYLFKNNFFYLNKGSFEIRSKVLWRKIIFFDLYNFKAKELITAILSFSVILTILISVPLNYRNVIRKVQRNIETDNIQLSIDQVNKLISICNPDDKVLFGCGQRIGDRVGETIIYYYLTHGASKRRFVWANLVIGTDYENYWLDDKIKFLVTKNPVILTSEIDGSESDIFMYNNDKMIIESEDINIQSLSIFMDNTNNDPARIVCRNQEEKETLIIIPGKFNGWINIDLSKIIVNRKIVLQILDLSKKIRIQGIRFDKQKTYWPWDQNISVSFPQRRQGNKTITFNSSELSPTPKYIVNKIIDDRGASVLASLSQNVHE